MSLPGQLWPAPGGAHIHPSRDETAALTAEIAQVEREIDERVAALCGL